MAHYRSSGIIPYTTELGYRYRTQYNIDDPHTQSDPEWVDFRRFQFSTFLQHLKNSLSFFKGIWLPDD